MKSVRRVLAAGVVAILTSPFILAVCHVADAHPAKHHHSESKFAA